MYEDLREAATKRVAAKTTFVITGITFVCTTVILVLLSFYLPEIAFWLLLPIPAMILALGVLYVLAFGFSVDEPLTTEWRERAIEEEMARLQAKRRGDHSLEDLSEDDRLELEELVRLKEKWER